MCGDRSIPSKFDGKISKLCFSSTTASIALRHSEVQPPTRTDGLLARSISRRACSANAAGSDRPSAISHFQPMPATPPLALISSIARSSASSSDLSLIASGPGLRMDQADHDRSPPLRDQLRNRNRNDRPGPPDLSDDLVNRRQDRPARIQPAAIAASPRPRNGHDRTVTTASPRWPGRSTRSPPSIADRSGRDGKPANFRQTTHGSPSRLPRSAPRRCNERTCR